MNRLAPLLAGLKLFPDGVHTELLARFANHLLRGQEIAERLDYLEGKRICLTITDTGSSFHVRVARRRLARSSSHLGWDVRISGGLEDFWRLANRSEDPDTLFFNRDLKLEGDTEAALYLKNLLDAMEFDLDLHLQDVAGARLAPYVREIIDRSALIRRAQKLARI